MKLCACGCGAELRPNCNGRVATFKRGHSQNNLRHGAAVGGKLLPEYNIWFAMRSRCSNPNVWNYKNYGGRGIRVKFKSFQEFFAEVGPRPPGTQIDRINNDGHYEPGNVRWATIIQQRYNRRDKHA